MHELSVSPELAGYILSLKKELNHKSATETVAFLFDIRVNKLTLTLPEVTPVEKPKRSRVYMKERHFQLFQQLGTRFGLPPGQIAKLLLLQLFSNDPLLLGAEAGLATDSKSDFRGVKASKEETSNVKPLPTTSARPLMSDHTKKKVDALGAIDSLIGF